MRAIAACVTIAAALTPGLLAHDLERTRVVLSFAPDRTFTLDVSHDPDWLLLRLESFAGGVVPARLPSDLRDARLRELGDVMVDRVVIWVDGREIRPDSAHYLADASTFRLRGRVPPDARTLRWLYGPVIDQYPLVVQRADGRMSVELIDGSNWSGTIDLSGQFQRSRLAAAGELLGLVSIFALALWWRTR